MGTPVTQQQQSTSVLQLRGLPYTARESDIREFLNGYCILEIVLGSRQGDCRATGEAIALLGSSTDAAAARQALHCHRLGNRYVEIFASTLDDLAAAREGQLSDLATGSTGSASRAASAFVITLRGLPYATTADQVVDFLGSTVHLANGAEAVTLLSGEDGRPLGEALVRLPSEDAQRAALQRHRATLGGRVIELHNSTLAVLQQARLDGGRSKAEVRGGTAGSHDQGMLRQMQPPLLQPPPPPRLHAAGSAAAPAALPVADAEAHGATIQLRGLPYSAGVEEITEWLSGFRLADDGIKIVTQLDSSGLPLNTGLAFVRFESVEEAQRAAAAKHRKHIGNRYIKCLPVAPVRSIQARSKHPRPILGERMAPPGYGPHQRMLQGTGVMPHPGSNFQQEERGGGGGGGAGSHQGIFPGTMPYSPRYLGAYAPTWTPHGPQQLQYLAQQQFMMHQMMAPSQAMQPFMGHWMPPAGSGGGGGPIMPPPPYQDAPQWYTPPRHQPENLAPGSHGAYGTMPGGVLQPYAVYGYPAGYAPPAFAPGYRTSPPPACAPPRIRPPRPSSDSGSSRYASSKEANRRAGEQGESAGAPSQQRGVAACEADSLSPPGSIQNSRPPT